ncbi:MAG TPA: hypothetical protein PLJ84_01985 [Bacteroidales bacterium]|nr:hypothetical protein [Bacteroidales bacterium]HPT01338.1 hypothetical protein [Bacteroidales bacterium]
MYAGTQATWVPERCRGHAWIQAGYNNSSGKATTTGEYAMVADSYTNSWHKIKIMITQDHFVRFYIDDVLIWSPGDKISSQQLQGKHLVLGFTSSGNVGKAYHNYVKVTYPDYY